MCHLQRNLFPFPPSTLRQCSALCICIGFCIGFLLFMIKMFHVIEFTSLREIAVAPSNWMTHPGICLWPPVRTPSKITKLVKERSIPEANWQQYDVRTLGSFATYEEARKRLKKAEDTSDLQSDVEVCRKKKRKRCLSESEGSDDESQSLLPSAPIIPTHKQVTTSNMHFSVPISQVSPPPCPTPVQQHPKTYPHIPLQNTPQILSIPSTSFQPQYNTQFNTQYLEQPLTPQTHTTQANEGCSCSKLQLHILKSIEKEVTAHTQLLKTHAQLLQMHTQMMAKLLGHHQIPSSGPSEVAACLPQDCPIPLPVSNIQDLDALNRYLENNGNFSQMVSYFSSFGGQGLKRILHRLLPKVIQQELSLQMNWMGRRGKHAFSQYKHLLGVIFQATKCNIQENLTLDDVEKCVKDWLRFAPDRYGGRNSRKQPLNYME